MTAPFSIARQRDVLDLDALDDIAGYAKVHGRDVAVHHLDAAAYRAINQLSTTGTVDVLVLYDAAARCCPDLTRAEVDALSGFKIGRLLAVAEIGVKAVEALIPNGPRSTATTEEVPSTPDASPSTSAPAQT